jgi:dihydropteroate synthase
MAIVNRTPDSFFDQGATYEVEAAIARVDQAVAEGADIIDIGGVKAGPGPDVDEAEEIRRVGGFVALVRARHPGVVISVDTWRASVGRAVAEAGADLLNDAWGGYDPLLAEVAAEFGVGLVCSHAGGLAPRTDPHRVAYDDVVSDVKSTVVRLAERAVALGVRRDGIVVDPAHDFAKNTRHSLEVSRRLDELVATGWPVLVALSNKKFIGETLDAPTGERLIGTMAATAVAAWQGARVFRAHNVRETRQALDMVASIRGVRQPAVARRGLA